MTSQPDLATFFHTLRTNPSKAETLIPQYPEHEQHTIVFTATQTATRTTWNTKPPASQIRALATHMRQRFDEPIDAYAIATTINLVFNPTSTQLQHRYDAIDSHTKRRMAFLIPSALHSFTQPTPTETETWVKTTIQSERPACRSGRAPSPEAAGQGHARQRLPRT